MHIYSLPGEGAFFLGAGGFINAARSMAAFLSDTITDGETACLPRWARGLRLPRRGDRDLDLYEDRVEALELLEVLRKKKKTSFTFLINT